MIRVLMVIEFFLHQYFLFTMIFVSQNGPGGHSYLNSYKPYKYYKGLHLWVGYESSCCYDYQNI